MPDPIDILVSSIAAETNARFRQWFDAADFCESPIEKYLIVSVRVLSWWFTPDRRLVGLRQPPEGTTDNVPDEMPFWPQAKVGRYRPDFIFYRASGDKWEGLVVECDGHAFHEKTKEQVQRDKDRDRYIQDLGFRLYHFSGSEIYRDPVRCAFQIIAWFEGISFVEFENKMRKEGLL